MKKYLSLIVLIISSTPLQNASVKTVLINRPVVTLMTRPTPRGTNYKHSNIQATQLLLGETVTVHREKDGWCEVRVPEQRVMYKGRWGVITGWLPKTTVTPLDETTPFKPNALVIAHSAPLTIIEKRGTSIHKTTQTLILSFCNCVQKESKCDTQWLVRLPDGRHGMITETALADKQIQSLTEEDIAQLRTTLVERGLSFLGDPYVWGGRSAHNPAIPGISGTDCSGLTHLLYRSVGINLPRNAHSQYEKSTKIAHGSHLRPGDLIFVYNEQNSQKQVFFNAIGHVLMYLGNNKLLETEGEASGHCRVVLGTQRFGRPIETIKSGDVVENFRTFARSPLGNKQITISSPFGRCRLVLGTFLQPE